MGITIVEINELQAANQELEARNQELEGQLEWTLGLFKNERLETEKLTKEVQELKFKLNFIKVLINKVE